MVFKAFESGIFLKPEESKQGKGFKILTPKQMLKRLPIALAQISAGKKSSYNNNKFKISAPKWSEEFKLSDGSYSISDIQDHFEYILKKHSKNVDNP